MNNLNAPKTFLVLLLPLALLTILLTPFLGASLLTPDSVLDRTSPEYLIFWRWRLPRTLGAFFAGAGFGLAGLILQAMFRTPLASPFTLGISSGASLGAAFYIRLGAFNAFPLASGAFFSALTGCALATFLVGALSWRSSFGAARLLLAGISINFLFSSLVMLLQYASNANDAVQIMRWLMGSLSGLEFGSLYLLAPIVLLSWLYALSLHWELDLLVCGDDLAQTRGISPKNLRIRLFGLTSILVGTLVSITGPIGFVGMIAPQICRRIQGYSHRILIATTCLLGGIFLCFCDLVSRSLLAPAEMPVGIVTALLGAPFFLWIIFRGGASAADANF